MDASTLALQAIGGFTIGALVGYAARKLAQWLLLLVGLALLPTYLLWMAGIITVNWDALASLVASFLSWLGIQATNATQAMMATGTLGIASIAGFVFGFASPVKHCVAPATPRRKFVRRR